MPNPLKSTALKKLEGTWRADRGVKNDARHYAYLSHLKRVSHANASERLFIDVWHYCPPYAHRRHLIEDMIKTSFNPDDLILDPFARSFIVAECAHALNRGYIGIDSHRDHYEQSVEKIAQSTH